MKNSMPTIAFCRTYHRPTYRQRITDAMMKMMWNARSDMESQRPPEFIPSVARDSPYLVFGFRYSVFGLRNSVFGSRKPNAECRIPITEKLWFINVLNVLEIDR